jgi:ribosomal protein S18 acetylase RimI-like enzyme
MTGYSIPHSEQVTLKNNKTVLVRCLEPGDKQSLYNYLQLLSPESRSRFGPHPFDWSTICAIFDHRDESITRYIAVSESENAVVAYMLIKQGMIEADQQRYSERNQFFEHDKTVTFAPSVADAWQSSGLGSAMTAYIEKELRNRGINKIILWGGVQASNLKAVNLYKKAGYEFIASFWYDEKDNYDMIKEFR